MKAAFLLINDGNESDWSTLLQEVVTPMGSLTIISEEATTAEIRREHYDLVIIDAATVQGPVELVSQLHGCDASIRVIVAAVTPTWQEARAVLRAGAADYLRRPTNKEELLWVIQTTLDFSASR